MSWSLSSYRKSGLWALWLLKQQLERTVYWFIQPFQQFVTFIASVSKKQGLFPDPSVHEINRGVPTVILL